MPSQQRLVHIYTKQLKNLVDVTVKFEEEKRLTAILRPNGFGKSTLLHVLAASFKPARVKKGDTIAFQGEDFPYSKFFPSTPHGAWANTQVDILYTFRNDGAPVPSTGAIQIRKGMGPWRPFSSSRPERETYFIGVTSAIPAIEKEWPTGKLRYKTHDLTDADSVEIRAKTGEILKREYTRFHSNVLPKQKALMGVEYQGVNYSALSMGAGEQRLFEILRVVKKAGKYALILIDEIDLLLHTDALHRLLAVLNQYATSKKLQIIFTTHRESVIGFDSFVAIRHLYRSPTPPHKTFCFEDTRPDAIYRLTGENQLPLRVCCEDDVAGAIIEKLARQVGVGKYVEIFRYGPASNCFTLAGALILGKQLLGNSLFVLDGDTLDATEDGRRKGINRALNGTEEDIEERQAAALNCIVQFQPDAPNNPEHMLHKMVCSVEIGNDVEEREVIVTAHEVAAEADSKIRLLNLMERLGGSKERALGRIVEVATKAPYWKDYTAQVRIWLEQKKAELVESTLCEQK